MQLSHDATVLLAAVAAGSLLKRLTMGVGSPPEPPVTPDVPVTA